MTASVPSRRRRIDAATMGALRRRFAGAIVGPGEPAYEDARQVANRMFDRHPAMIARAATVADVVAAVAFAREQGLQIAVRSGGHSNAGHGSADDALVIDLGQLRDLQLDPERRVAWAQPGITAGEYSIRAHAFGLGTSFGDTPSVGIAGLTLCGGIGYLVRKQGLTIDNLLGVELVTAEGRTLKASEAENPDLFWALRGGGGNFGIVTRAQYRLSPVGTVYAGWLVLPATAEVLGACADIAADAPDELTTVANLFRMPALPFVAPEIHGRLALTVTAVYAGDPGQGEALLAALRGVARPLFDGLRPMPYPEIYRYQRTALLGPHGTAMRTTFLSRLHPEVIEAMLDLAARPSSPSATIQFRVLGGAAGRAPEAATAYAHRDRPILFSSFVEFDPGGDPGPHLDWLRGLWATVGRYGSGAYVGFLQGDAPSDVRDAYPASTYTRLALVKRAFDPDNVFCFNANIAPARRSPAAGPSERT